MKCTRTGRRGANDGLVIRKNDYSHVTLKYCYSVSGAVVDSYSAIVMLRNGGFESWRQSVSTFTFTVVPDSVNGNVSVTTFNQTIFMNDVTALNITSSSVFESLNQSNVGHMSTPEQRPPAPVELSTSGFIVGPMMYVYFTAVNTSDAGFTVDLLFQHYLYAEASHRFCCLLFIVTLLVISVLAFLWIKFQLFTLKIL